MNIVNFKFTPKLDFYRHIFNYCYKYMLTLIDCFSKKAYAAPLKDKTAKHVKLAIESILPDNVKHLQTDEGKEFFNKDFKEFMKTRNITHYHTYSHIKASIVERFNRTLKTGCGKCLVH